MRPPRPRSLPLCALVLLAVAAAPALRAGDDDELLQELEAATRPPRAGPELEAALHALVEKTLPRVSKVMGLAAPRRLEVRVVDRAEARRKLLAVLEREYPGDALERLAEALAAVGLVSAGTDLRREAEEAYGNNVSGFYDGREQVLFLLSDQPLALQPLVVAHELAHAVQDQHLHLARALDRVRGSEDAQLALAAALEGQAQEVAALVLGAEAQEGLGSATGELGGLAAELTQTLSQGAAASAAQAGAQASVPWLGLQISFPYVAGGHLVEALRTQQDPVAGLLLRRPPASTAQVLDPALYRADERPRSGSVGLARLLPGSAERLTTTLGAANLDLFGELHQQGARLGAGWRGDQLELVHLGGRPALAWAVSFDTPAHAAALLHALAQALHASEGAPAEQPDGSVYVVAREGSTVVLLENVPEAQRPRVTRAALGALGR